MRRVCYAGTYEHDYPRNALMIQALRDAGVRVEECHQPVFERERDKSGLALAAMLGLAVRLFAAYLRLIPDVALRLLRCDALITGYIGQLDTVVLGIVARIAGKPVIFNPLVSLTDTLVEDRRQLTEGSLPARAIRALDVMALRNASLVLADTDENARYFVDAFGLEPERVAVVQVGAPEDVFYPSKERALSQERLDILFVGKFIPLHGVATILKAAGILQSGGVPARIEMVGRGQEYAGARELADRLGLTNVTWTDWIPFDALGERIRRADAVLGVFDDGAKAGRVIPNKLHQALASGVPVITRESAAVNRFLRSNESAMLVPPADPDALASAIEELVDCEKRADIGRAGHESWQRWGSRRALARQMRVALDRLEFVR